MPRVAIVILIHNGEAVIEKCLEAVLKSDYKGKKRIIMFDNASTDGSRMKIAGLTIDDPPANTAGAVMGSMKNLGWAGGNNRAIALFDDWDLALFLNDDTEIRPNLVSELVKAYEKANYPFCKVSDLNKFRPGLAKTLTGIFGCRLLYPDGKTIQHASGKIGPTGHTSHLYHGFHYDPEKEDFKATRKPTVCDYVTGAAMAITRQCWAAMGPFYEGYGMYYEEVEYSVRARKEGFETVCIPSAVAIHHADQREGRSKLRFYLRYESSRLRFVWRNWSFRKLLRWARAERRWYRKNIKGNRSEHANAVRKVYKQMWWRMPWIVLTRRLKQRTNL